MESFIYIFGLVLVSVWILLGIDDLIWDIYTAAINKNKSRKLPISELDEKMPRLLAMIIASWQEDSVLGEVVDNITASVQYPKSMYHIFLGVYPNDGPTVAVAEALALRHENVHVVHNVRPGPTSKADNINNVFRYIRNFEQERNWSFGGVTVHDAEDVVHPYELKITNYLYDEYDALQFPVFPLQEMPKLKNLFKNMTVGTYADEFAENHYRTLVLRDSTGAFVPSAGTGFAISHRVLDTFSPEENIFPENSLTEDYKLSLTLHDRGFNIHYVLEKVQRLRNDGMLVWEYVATRSRFPSTFWAAVKQKTRWIYGITMQTFNFGEIFDKSRTFAFRYTMYKDWKAKIGNLLVLPGYFIFLYFAGSMIWELPPIYPEGTLSWYLCIVLTGMMIERQVLRSVAIYNVYGGKSAFVACFLPPILPMRLVWGNIINLVATMRAWKQTLSFGEKNVNKAKKSIPQRPAWSKTDHEFLPPPVLKRFHRNLGDIMLEKEYLSSDKLKNALQLSLQNGQRLGTILRSEGYISEKELLSALALLHQTIYVPIADGMVIREFAKRFEQELLEELVAMPLLAKDNLCVFALSDDSPPKSLEKLRKQHGLEKAHYVYSDKQSIMRGLKLLYSSDPLPTTSHYTQSLFTAGWITHEQALLVARHQSASGILEKDITFNTGLHVPK